MRFDIIRLDLDPLLRSNSQFSFYFAISFHAGPNFRLFSHGIRSGFFSSLISTILLDRISCSFYFCNSINFYDLISSAVSSFVSISSLYCT